MKVRYKKKVGPDNQGSGTLGLSYCGRDVLCVGLHRWWSPGSLFSRFLYDSMQVTKGNQLTDEECKGVTKGNVKHR